MSTNIEVIQVKVASIPSPNGGYQKAEVAYKDLNTGRVNSKTLVSFKAPEVFSAISNAAAGSQWTVSQQKNGQYWEWTQAMPGVSATQTAPAVPAGKAFNATPAPKSNFETSQERAARQVLIVKQSSLSVAAGLLSVGAKSPPNTDEVINLAQKFTNWVFDIKPGVEGLIDMPNDLGDMPQ